GRLPTGADGADRVRPDPRHLDVPVAAGAAGQPGVVHRRRGAAVAHPSVHFERPLWLAWLPDDALAIPAAAHDELPDEHFDHRYVQQRAQTVHTWQLLRRPLPDALYALLHRAARAGHSAVR